MHGWNAPPSNAQTNDEPSSAENANAANLLLLRAPGPDDTAAAGARVSIAQLRTEAGPVLLASSTARTAKAWPPSLRPP